jgi:dephospho-CoA kinase
MAKTVIGIVGKNGSGKDTVARILANALKAEIIAYSDVINKALEIFLEPEKIGRDDQSSLATYLRSKYGDGIISAGAKKMIDQMEDGVFILTGARDEGDLKLIRSFEVNFFLGVDAEERKRWERIRTRKEKADDHSSFEEFQKKEKLPSELKIPMLIMQADCIINNNGTPEDLEREVLDIIEIYQL